METSVSNAIKYTGSQNNELLTKSTCFMTCVSVLLESAVSEVVGLVGQGRGLIGLTPLEAGRERNSVALKRTLASLVAFTHNWSDIIFVLLACFCITYLFFCLKFQQWCLTLK